MELLADARAALASGPLCDACLGRLFAERSHGLANAERGHALRVTLALADDEPHEAPDGASCWVCEGECARVEELAERAATAVRGYEFDTYQVGTRVPPLLAENDALLRADAGLPEDAGEALNTELNREVGKRIGDRTGAEVEFGRPDVQFTIDLATDEVDVQVNSAFVYGRYRKLARDIPQTEWPCRECNATGYQGSEECPGCDGTGYRYDESVEELVSPPMVEALDGDDATFHGAGREDVDALMLGTGRPFVVEVDEPRRRQVDLDALEADVNEFADGRAAVEGLRVATHEMVERVKEHDASKTYRMAVAFEDRVDPADLDGALETLAGATIEQRTPQRVDHRRADTVRTREVYDADGALVADVAATTRGDGAEATMRSDGAEATGSGDDGSADVPASAVTPLDEVTEGEDVDRSADHAVLEVHGAGGLYVKELVSSDEGRTEPSLAGELGVGAEVTALDVLAVEGEDEPFADADFFRDVADPQRTDE